MKGFNYNGLRIYTHPEVYEPAEDTFQLLESMKIKPDDTVLEIGTGCGIIGLECARLGARVVATDINPYAVALTLSNIKQNKDKLKGSIEVRYGDLYSPLRKNERFSVVVFNPPYLPTRSSELIDDAGWFDISVNGGRDGLKIIRRFLQGLRGKISGNGGAYLMYSSLIDKKKFNTYIEKYNLHADLISSRRFDEEILEVYYLSIV